MPRRRMMATAALAAVLLATGGAPAGGAPVDPGAEVQRGAAGELVV